MTVSSDWRLRTRSLPLDRTTLMGILNVTPDSFSDGGRYHTAADAVEAGLAMVAAGAGIVDVGGESTRPGAAPVTAEEELSRVLPVIEGLVAGGVVVSVDTSKAPVAAAALEAGAEIVNDVTALGDPDLAGVLGRYRPGLVVMHMQGIPRTMQEAPHYDDVVGEVRDFLVEAAGRAQEAGLAPSQICIDPGIGFGKTRGHNLTLLAATDVLAATGYPVLIGASRKRFIGEILGIDEPAGRDLGTAAVTAVVIARGARVIRTHNISMIKEVAEIADAIVANQ